MKYKNIKKDFVDAYMYCYGATKTAAIKAYKNATQEYIEAVIDSLKQDSKKSFNCD